MRDPSHTGGIDAHPREYERRVVAFLEHIHIISTIVDASFSVNPRSCIVSFSVRQTGTVAGGTGRFAAATGSYTATVTGRGLAGRNPDGSCSMEQARSTRWT
jgi:hypothetical protein